MPDEVEQNFNYMKINELKQHEHGILNMFDGEEGKKSVNHNKPTGNRLSQREYDQIFSRNPSFNEKKAFVDLFRRKWRGDKGYSSMFDRMRSYRIAKSRSSSLLERKRQ